MPFLGKDDATGRRQADREPAFRMLPFDQTNVAVLATDTDLRITARNRAAERLHGWPAERAVGRLAREVIGPPIIADESEEILTRLKRGEKSPFTITELLRHDGTTVTVQGRGGRIPLGGRPAVQVILRDATPQLQHQAGAARERSGSGNVLDSTTKRDPEWRNFEVKKGGRFTQLRYAPAGT